MTSTAQTNSKRLLGRAALIIISVVALLGSAYTFVLLALHVYSLRANPGSQLRLVGLGEDQADGILPPGMQYDTASMTVEVDVVAHGVDHAFLAWQTWAWASRYGLAIVLLLSVVYLCWRLWRGTLGPGRAMSWWAAGLGALVLAVAVLAPWALIHADQLVTQAVGAPTEPQPGGTWFVAPGWSLQDTDWWLALFAALLFLLALLLRRAQRAERDTQGLI